MLARISNTQLLVAAMIAQIVPALVALKMDGGLAKLLALILALAIVAAATAFWYLARHRRVAGARAERLDQQWRDRALQAGFRGLSSYSRNDELPGQARRQLARRIATEVAHPGFNYGLVSGEVGAGKSSLLDSHVADQLEKAGFVVTFTRGLQEFRRDRSLETVLKTLRERIAAAERPVLIIDQFEEMLIEWFDPAQRQQLGAFLNQPVEDKAVRVLCSVRADYIIAMHDLAPALPDPTSARTLFPVGNLDEKEAAEIISECAARDRVQISSELARIIAGDLARGGRVRPPELQLVCQALESSSPEQSYREGGGADGILSDYVRNAMRYSAAPELASLVLRALCNFEALPPAKMRPQSLSQIELAVGVSAARGEALRLANLLAYLEQARLVVALRFGDDASYTLIHDYLVQPVALATSETTTQAEKANQLLRLHLTEAAADRSARIPFRRLRFIRRHADNQLLATYAARKLVRHSYVSGATRTGGVILLAGTSIALIIVAQSMSLTWKRSDIGTQMPDGSETRTSFGLTQDKHSVMSNFAGGEQITRWDLQSGALRWRTPGSEPVSAEGADIIAYKADDSASKGDESSVSVIDGPTGKISPTPLRASVMQRIGLTSAGDSIYSVSFARLTHTSASVLTTGPQSTLWNRRSPTSSAQVLPGFYNGSDASGRRILLGSGVAGRQAIDLWTVTETDGARFLKALVPEGTSSSSFAFDRSHRSLLVLASDKAGKTTATLWDLATAEILRTRAIALEAKGFVQVEAINDGHFLIKSDGFFDSRAAVSGFLLRAGDLIQPEQPSGGARKLMVLQGGQGADLVAWQTGGETYVWYPGRGDPIRVAGLRFRRSDRVIRTEDGTKMAILRKSGAVELWDTRTWVQQPIARVPGRAAGTRFTADGAGLLIQFTGGFYALIDLKSGSLVHIFYDLKDVEIAFYDPRCQRLNAWTGDGLVVRYARGRSWPFRGFVESGACS